MKNLLQSQFLTLSELKQYQFAKVKKTLQDAYEKIPFYKKSFESVDFHPDQFKTLNDINKIPFLEKVELKNKPDELLNKNYKGPLDRKTTGGSTGVAVSLIKDRVATAWLRGTMWRCYDWFGISQGDKQARFWGVPLSSSDQRRYRLIDFFMNRIRLSAFGFNEDQLYIYLRKIKKFKPIYFYGYLSMILEFAHFIESKGIDGRDFNLKAIISTSEVLYQQQKVYLESFFNCPVANEYGCGEVGIIGFSCEKGSLHLMSDNLLIEILDDSGNPVPPGGYGEIIVTELHSTAMPLIRYKIRDFAKRSDNDEGCECGRSLPKIDYLSGRQYDFLMAIDGRKYHGERFMYLLEDLQKRKRGVRQFQIIQKDRKEVIVNIVKENWASINVEEEIEKFLIDTLGQEMTVEFRSVDKVERDPSGKLRLIIQKMNQ